MADYHYSFLRIVKLFLFFTLNIVYYCKRKFTLLYEKKISIVKMNLKKNHASKLFKIKKKK